MRYLSRILCRLFGHDVTMYIGTHGNNHIVEHCSRCNEIRSHFLAPTNTTTN